MKAIMLVTSILFGYCIIQLIILLLFFHFHKLPGKETEETRDSMDEIKIAGTKGYIDIEYDGSIARFDGELCVDGFGAYANSLIWIKWNNRKGHVVEEDRIKIIRKAQEYEDKNFKINFLDENGNKLEHLHEEGQWIG